MLVFDGKKFVPLHVVLARPDIVELVDTFGLELVWASRYNPPTWKPSWRSASANKRPEVPFITRYMERNHHRTDFRNVYKSNYNKAQLSLDWDA